MTKDEFIDQYCKNSGITREFFDEKFEAVKCDCEYHSCRGWQATCFHKLFPTEEEVFKAMRKAQLK